ncbi:TrwJ1 protein precursor [Bartonella tribocorum CIP 105476]|uniref:TrwJ1 protein n=2 Tax=Bartonella tribocorum TaxID=85701 RepID=Q7X262_9HYPH|nr:type IV secretion system protein [Bartonella tribocorum]CAD42845.1 TrwJ1 protein [Bartonella tribocorum]CAK02482.1 TrwJ1 protein precursor [Bartonella tribocorum CIP 105476]
MKKQVISIAVAITLGVLNPAKAFIVGGVPDSSSLYKFFGGSYSNAPEPEVTIPKKKVHPVTPLLDILRKQLEQTKKIHDSITGNQKFDTEKLKMNQTDNTSFFLKNPETLYNKNTYSTLSSSLKNILKEEEIPASIHESSDFINKRIQYAAITDKAVSLKTFQEASNRFQQIEELLNEIKTTKDLKSMAELQAHIIGMLAKLQNETAKLQMVTHLRNAEYTLIKQQKDRHNIRILNSKNTKMPTIKFIR